MKFSELMAIRLMANICPAIASPVIRFPARRTAFRPLSVCRKTISFVHLFEYKTNVRQNEVMKNRVVNLTNEEIAALAAYFGSLNPQ